MKTVEQYAEDIDAMLDKHPGQRPEAALVLIDIALAMETDDRQFREAVERIIRAYRNTS